MNYSACFILFFCLLAPALGQNRKIVGAPCDDPDCRKAKAKYRFCNTSGDIIDKCSDDPNNEPGMKPYKVKLPLEVCPVNLDLQGLEDNYKLVQYPPVSPLNPVGGPVVFDIRHTLEKLLAARDVWNTGMCPPQGPDNEYQECCLQVKWSLRTEDMGDAPEAYANVRARTYSYSGPKEGHKCIYECLGSFLVLNRQLAFLDPDKDGFPRRYFVTERHNWPAMPSPHAGGYQWVDMQSLFEHELGHWLGFLHPDEEDDDGNICDGGGSIMLSGNAKALVNRVVTLSAGDVCMFMKLYCCEQTKRVEWSFDSTAHPDPHPDHSKPGIARAGTQHTGCGFSVSPNPVRSDVISLSFDCSIGRGDSEIRIADATGVVVITQKLNEGARNASIDVNDLPRGIYMVQLVRRGEIFGRKFIIE